MIEPPVIIFTIADYVMYSFLIMSALIFIFSIGFWIGIWIQKNRDNEDGQE